MPAKKIKGNLLFWKITAVFTALLVVLGVVFVMIASRFSKSYYTTAHQELYGDIAQHLATFTQPLKNGKPDTAVTHDIIHSTMVANPSVEVYLLDTAGNITDYVVPDTTVQVHHVNINTVKQWLAADAMHRPMGDNPKQPGKPSIFSAAPVYENGRLTGYVYAVLASEKQKEILSSINSQFYFRLSTYIFFAALLVAFFVGVVTFFLITGSISKITSVVKRFKEGDYSARIEGNASGDLGMLSTTFNEMADVIVDNFDKITATDKFRQELIANVSHDLRTPLSIMQGYVETLMMKKNVLSENDKEKYLGIVHDSAKKLSGLVEQLFQYAKLEANLVTPEKEAFFIGELASDILMSYQLKAGEKNIHLNMQAPSNLPRVFADIALTERVFQNLLDNAFKFTPDGGNITIQLSETNSGIKVQVADTGIGIAPEDQAYIFERYKQLGKEASSKKGIGIGLAIVKKILELHQTTIEVMSEPGKGTAFRFVLPTINSTAVNYI
ncbi:sensor histidine kinase [Parafilimonas terrae]|uniref:histidine kinase n=1 Tax=Parafilimonas terrae TaxID=1465490 RepID=A0A1I5TLW7_9BACT|nr:HAMP domain-containing sensor histidine kinase [Parafilimonas terrae]SFP84045.1 Signal transduction histidine kinase [Parafilimonas terrae]